jgi:hypothetical protein
MVIDEAERQRRRACLQTHMEAENRHDLEGVMATFADKTELLYNRLSFRTDGAIRLAHIALGMSPSGGAIEGLTGIVDGEHFTDDELVIEGRMCGKHVAEFAGFAPTGADVELPYVAFYRFDAAGLLTSERVVMNLGPLSGSDVAYQ